MRRREFNTLLLGAIAAPSSFWPCAARADQDDRARTLLVRLLREQAENLAARIGQFVNGIESQMGWTVQVAWSANAVDEQRFDLLRLLRQVPAISEVTRIDGTGREQVRVSRISANPPGGNADVSKEPKFTEAMAKTVYYGPIVFRRPERATPVPFMTLSLRGVRPDAGVTAAEVNLKILWDLVAHIQIGERGNAYVIDSEGRIIAHRDLSKIERDVSSLAQVRAARGGAAQALTALDIDGRQVLCVYAPVGRLGWFVVAELPVDEADALAR